MIDFEHLGERSENAARAYLQRATAAQKILDQHIPDDSRNIVEKLLIVAYVAGYAQALTDQEERIRPLTFREVDEMARALSDARHDGGQQQ